jgi:hypothetical protein
LFVERRIRRNDTAERHVLSAVFLCKLVHPMREIVADKSLVAYCGLYCGACGRYLRGRCPGCRENPNAGWCKVRTCSIDGGLSSCADCSEHTDPMACSKFNNVISRLFGFVFRSNRAACIAAIRDKGLEAFAGEMASRRAQSMPR